MKRCLLDVIVLLPLLVRHHEHHQLTVRWFDGLATGEAVVCRFVQLALIRLLGNRTIMGNFALSAAVAWNLIDNLMDDERMEFLAEPSLVETVFPTLLRYNVPTNKLVGDTYLAAFSIAAGMRFTTIDKSFSQFDGVDLELLAV